MSLKTFRLLEKKLLWIIVMIWAVGLGILSLRARLRLHLTGVLLSGYPPFPIGLLTLAVHHVDSSSLTAVFMLTTPPPPQFCVPSVIRRALHVKRPPLEVRYLQKCVISGNDSSGGYVTIACHLPGCFDLFSWIMRGCFSEVLLC